MPYETVKVIKRLPDYPEFGIELEDDNVWRRLHFYHGDISNIFIIGTVAELFDKNERIPVRTLPHLTEKDT